MRAELPAEKALVGFAGGPFTVAAYLVEGRPSREFSQAKAFMLREPAVWDALLARLADVFAGYVAAQVAAGADVIQLFDSWVGVLSPAQYRERAAVHSARVLGAVDVPTIHFGTGAGAPARRARRSRRRRDRARLAHAARRGLGARARPCRAGQPRPGGAARRMGDRRARGARRAEPGRRAPRARVQPRATACCPAPIRTLLTQLAALVRDRTVAQVAA